MEVVNPQQLAEEGRTAYNKGDYRSAASLFKAAADGFSLLGDNQASAEMLNNSSVSYLKAGDGQNALDAVISVDEVFKISGDLKRQAMTLGNQAAALDKLDRVDEALIKFIESADLFASIGENELRAYVCQSISAMQLRNGRYLEAYATMQSGVMGVKNPNLTQKILKSLMDVPFKFLQ